MRRHLLLCTKLGLWFESQVHEVLLMIEAGLHVDMDPQQQWLIHHPWVPGYCGRIPDHLRR